MQNRHDADRTPQNRDPYAPPPMHHDKSGKVVRIALVAVMLGAAAWGYTSFQSQPELVAQVKPAAIQEQRVADAGYTASPATFPQAPAASDTAPSSATVATPERNARPAPASRSSAEPEPSPPPAAITPPIAPDLPPPTDAPAG